MIPANPGQRIQHARARAGLTQQSLANLAGIHRQTIQSLELNKSKPRLSTIYRIASALRVPMGWIFEGLESFPEDPFPSTTKDPVAAESLDSSNSTR